MKSNLLKAIVNQDAKALTNKITGFQFRSKTNRLVASNNYIDLNTMSAYSYNWWCYSKPIQGLMVFNEYRYSASTAKHQSNMKSLLYKLDQGPQIYIKTSKSISEFTLFDVENALRKELADLNAQLSTCKRKSSAKKERLEFQIEQVKDYLGTVADARRKQIKLA